MGYTIDDESTSLEDVRRRLQATDLIPSHQPLLDEMARKLAAPAGTLPNHRWSWSGRSEVALLAAVALGSWVTGTRNDSSVPVEVQSPP